MASKIVISAESKIKSFVQVAANIIHEVIRDHCESIGDHSIKPWAQLSDQDKEPTFVNIKYLLDNPEASPEDLHDRWVEMKTAQGWVLGPTKDPQLKTHPCMVPYDQLSPHDREKDILFVNAVRSLSDAYGI